MNATTYKNGIEEKINKARIKEDAQKYINTAGQIIGKTNEGFLVKTNDNFIEILEVESEEKLRIGDKLG